MRAEDAALHAREGSGSNFPDMRKRPCKQRRFRALPTPANTKIARRKQKTEASYASCGGFVKPGGASNAVARWNFSPGSGISSANLQTFAGLSNAVARRQSSPSGGGSPVHLRNPAGPPNVIAGRQTSPGRVSSSAALAACGRARSCGISRIAGFLPRYSLLKRPCMQGRFC